MIVRCMQNSLSDCEIVTQARQLTNSTQCRLSFLAMHINFVQSRDSPYADIIWTFLVFSAQRSLIKYLDWATKLHVALFGLSHDSGPSILIILSLSYFDKLLIWYLFRLSYACQWLMNYYSLLLAECWHRWSHVFSRESISRLLLVVVSSLKIRAVVARWAYTQNYCFQFSFSSFSTMYILLAALPSDFGCCCLITNIKMLCRVRFFRHRREVEKVFSQSIANIESH